jgi:hypothetical protein
MENRNISTGVSGSGGRINTPFYKFFGRVKIEQKQVMTSTQSSFSITKRKYNLYIYKHFI